MSQQRGTIAFFDVAIQLLISLDASYEILKVRNVGELDLLVPSDLIAFFYELPSLTSNDQIPICAVEGDAVFKAFLPVWRPQPLLVDQYRLLLGKPKSCHLRIRRLLNVPSENQFVGSALNFAGKLHAEPPAGNIQIVDAVIPHIARAIVPHPTPTVGVAIVVEWTFGSGTLPDFPVETARNRAISHRRHAATQLAVPSLRHMHLANSATAQQLDRLAVMRNAAA